MAAFYFDFKDNNPVERTEAFNAYSKEIKKYPRLSDEEIDALITRMNETDDENLKRDIRDSIIMAHQQLLISLSKRYANTENVDQLDLINEGVFGLIKAIEKYKPGAGSKFYSYAADWVRDEMSKAAYAAPIVKTGGKKYFTVFTKCYDRLAEQYEGYVPDDLLLEEINKEVHESDRIASLSTATLAMSVGYSEFCDKSDKFSDMSCTGVDSLITGRPYWEGLSDTESRVDADDQKRLVKLALGSIKNKKDKELICDLYGIDRPQMGYEMAAWKYGTSEVTVKKREKKALEAMKTKLSKMAL